METIEIDDEIVPDSALASLLDSIEAEAAAKSTKRQKTAAEKEEEEGPYMAALRGSRSSLWQQQKQQEVINRHNKNYTNNNISTGRGSTDLSSNINIGSGGGGCFKCGMDGHWARDCTGKKDGPSAGAVDGDVAEKPCPCGIGACLVLTSNTPKNPGRKFYRCPVRQESGGCNFFEWCDNPSSGLPTSGSATSYQSNPSVPNFPCPCGAGSCLVLVTKTGKNAGKQYYRCPANEGVGSCGYFKWCEEPSSVSFQPSFSLQTRGTYNSSSGQISGERNGSSCFKCGEGGHWARDCTKPTSDRYADVGGNRPASSGSGSCFKCGEAGHWARDCNAQDTSTNNSSQKAPRFRTFSNKY